MSVVPIKRALLSVYNKDGIVAFARFLQEKKVSLVSTGGTHALLKKEGVNVSTIEEITGFPEILDGRVKTLHPHIHAGLLAKKGYAPHQETLRKRHILPFDLVVVNLYPFLDLVARDGTHDKAHEDAHEAWLDAIDIGGPTLIRAAAKNYHAIAVATHPRHYALLQKSMERHDNGTDIALRHTLSAQAFALTAHYDATIADWFASASTHQKETDSMPPYITITATKKHALRYGENPQQQAAFYQRYKPHGVASLAQGTLHQGKELSWNNLNDTAAALRLIREFTEPCCVIIKHANPCGVALAQDTITHAWHNAYRCDPQSAFGGIVAINRPLDDDIAHALRDVFLDVIVAPSLTDTAKKAMAHKKTLRIITCAQLFTPYHSRQHRTDARQQWDVRCIEGDLLVQHYDESAIPPIESMLCPTKKQPSQQEWDDMLFAMKVCKHVASNAIVYASMRATIGIGAGQMSRLDSVHIASTKSAPLRRHAQQQGDPIVAASDAFFPFPDSVNMMARDHVCAVMQPGGSRKDQESIDAANTHHMAMVMSGQRFFRH